MSNNLFEVNKNHAIGIINAIVMEKNIEGFIYNFFNYYEYKKDCIINTNKKKYLTIENSLYRTNKHYDEENSLITLTDSEINHINDFLFQFELNKVYENAQSYFLNLYNSNINSFPNELNSFIEELIEKLNSNYFNAYNSGQIENLNSLNLQIMRLLVKERYENFKTLIERFSTSSLITNNKNNNSDWHLVFIEILRGNLIVKKLDKHSVSYHFKNKEFSTPSALGKEIAVILGKKENTIRPIVTSTINTGAQKDIFIKKKIVDIERLIKEYGNNMCEYFQKRYDDLVQ
ncbi:hypothetical protein [Flavobacterium oreochromis]|uniref:hypothetical protein n=1 Tax=Flavobacterium oreochromis TaxID=2906078 RepID=UPI00385C9C9D